MPTVVVPFRGETAKQRLAPAPEDLRTALAQAMFEDVLAAAEPVGAVVLADEPGGQGQAVEGALRRIQTGPVLVVNADLPCARPRDLLTLLGALPEGGLALVEAADGTTNALALASPRPVRAALRRAQRRALPARGPSGSASTRRSPRSRTWPTTWTRSPTSSGSSTASARAPLQRSKRCAPACRGEGRRPRRRARRRRASRARSPRRSTRRADDRRERRRRRRDPRPARLARPRHDPLHAHRAARRERAGAARGRRWNALETVAELGGESWFRLGDLDLGVHLVRTEALRRGEPLSAVTARHRRARSGSSRRCCRRPTSGCARWLATPAGELPFQEWFVARGHRDEVDGVRFEGAEAARPAPGVLEALEAADLIAIAPSNPFVSVGPILAVAGIREALERRAVPARRGQPADRRRGGARPGRADAGAAGGRNRARRKSPAATRA